MRGVLGFVLANAWFVVVGLSLLRAIGLTGGDGRRELLMVGPGLVFGVAAIAPLLVLCLVIGVPITVLTVLAVGLVVVLGSGVVIRRRRRAPAPAPAPAPEGSCGARLGLGPLGPLAAAVAVAYAAVGALAFANAPSRGDDARIWSLRGLTLIDFHRLQPEIFLNPTQAGGHAVYPLLQPIVETIVAEAMGTPQLRIYHAELWILAISVLWTVAMLLARRAGAPDWRRAYWLAPLGLIALTPFLILNVYVGDADITGSVLFGAAIVAFAVWLESGERRYVAAAALLLAAAASTKDEEFLSAIPVLFFALVLQIRHRSAGGGWRIPAFYQWLGALIAFACLILPWRLWLAAHHLTDSVQPQLPQALSPVWLINRGTISQVAPAMLNQILVQWSWLAAVFLVTCGVCLVTRTAVRVTLFYLAAVFGVLLALFWLYVATPLSLSFLIPTSMDRTVGVFMVAAGMASAHLLSMLLSTAGGDAGAPAQEESAEAVSVSVSVSG